MTATAYFQQTLAMPTQLNQPNRHFVAKGNRQTLLAMGAAHHHGVAMPRGQCRQHAVQRYQLLFKSCLHLAQHQHGPGIGHVLHSSTGVHPLGIIRFQSRLHQPYQALHGVAAGLASGAEFLQQRGVHRQAAAAGGNGVCRIGGNQIELGLHLG